jgi:restriction endonuclease Mrr
LAEQPKRGSVKITSSGIKWLMEKPKDFEDAQLQSQGLIREDTPDDLLEKGYRETKESCMTELLEKVI